MGLDDVELMLEAERAFGVVIGDADAARVVTVGDFCDVIVAECLRRGDECRSNMYCVDCGYLLKGLRSDLCPECGEPVPPLPSQSRFAEGAWAIVVRLVAEQLGVEASSIQRSTRFVEDLRME